MIRTAADFIAAAVIRLGAPLFRAVGRQPGAFPRYLRQADRAGVHFRSTAYYDPLYAESELPEDTTGERILPGLDLDEAGQLALLERLRYRDELAQFPDCEPDGEAFGHRNVTYAYSDAESLYSMLRHFRPRRMVEIGSGISTCVASSALARNAAETAGPACRHVCIEPYHGQGLERLGVELIRERVQDLDLALFHELEAGDVLFVDSSHVIRPFGDVLWIYQRIVPTLAPGVLVHVHDIFTPRDYPEKWLRRERKLWNEQYLLETMLMHSRRYRVRLAMSWLKHHHWEALAAAFPAAARRPEHPPGAFWFEIVGER